MLEDLEMNQERFAKVLGVSHHTINEIIQGQTPITVDMAIRIGKALGNSPQLWLNLQQKVDIWDGIQTHREVYDKVPTLV